jgi:hypothetical protein
VVCNGNVVEVGVQVLSVEQRYTWVGRRSIALGG